MEGLQVDLPFSGVHSRDDDFQAIPEPEDPAAALAPHLVARRIVVKVVSPERAHVNQSVHAEVFERDEESEAGHPAHLPVVDLAYAPLHEAALEAKLDFARRPLGAPFGHRRVLSQGAHGSRDLR